MVCREDDTDEQLAPTLPALCASFDAATFVLKPALFRRSQGGRVLRRIGWMRRRYRRGFVSIVSFDPGQTNLQPHDLAALVDHQCGVRDELPPV
jgi:hypothetical protein